MILITGIGRSGTKYTNQLLNKAGIITGHEMLNVDGIVCWKHAIYSYNFKQVFHQVRNPLNCISSLQTISKNSMQLMAKYVDIDKQKSWLNQCMQSYLLWNEMSGGRAVKTYQVERIETVWNELVAAFGRKNIAMPEMDKTVHSRKGSYKVLSVADLNNEDKRLTNKIIKLAKKYGYDF